MTYFEEREGAHMLETFWGTRTLRYLWYEQRGLCTQCNTKITRITGWRLHCCVPRVKGGPLVLRTAFYFIPSAMIGFIVSVFPSRNRVSSKEAFEGLELGEGKPSRPVLRGPGGRKAAWLLGSYQLVRRISTDKRAGVDWRSQLPGTATPPWIILNFPFPNTLGWVPPHYSKPREQTKARRSCRTYCVSPEATFRVPFQVRVIHTTQAPFVGGSVICLEPLVALRQHIFSLR